MVQGALNSVHVGRRKLNIKHGPITALKWSGMRMDFGVMPRVNLGALKPGSKIVLTLPCGADGMFLIDEVKPGE